MNILDISVDIFNFGIFCVDFSLVCRRNFAFLIE